MRIGARRGIPSGFSVASRFGQGKQDAAFVSSALDVLYTYRDGGFDGEWKISTSRGFPDHGDSDGAWGTRFVWPFKADYRIAYLADDYSTTIIGRNRRDSVWIMARSPHMAAPLHAELVRRVREMEYDTSQLREVPQQPEAKREERNRVHSEFRRTAGPRRP